MIVPRISRQLLAWATAPDERDDVLADLAEEAAAMAHDHGARPARSWYRQQVRRSILPLLKRRAALAVAQLHGVHPMHDLGSDLAFAVRRMTRRPIVPVVVMLTLAAGIAAVTGVFSVADTVLFRPLPLPDPNRIVRLYSTLSGPSQAMGPVASVNYLDLKDVTATSHTLATTAAYAATSLTWRADSGAESLAVVRVSSTYADVLGLRPTRGRWFTNEEFATGADAEAVITDGFWQRAFGGRDDAVGQTLDLEGRRVRIVGVLPKTSFLFPAAAEIWMPLVIAPNSFLNNRQSVQLAAVARVRPDSSVELASSELATINHQLQQAYPMQSGKRTLALRPLGDSLSGPIRPTLLLLIAAVLAVLVIAAANVAGLLLSDAAVRRQEFAIRGALGASGIRLTRQVLIEMLVLVGMGGLIGLIATPALTQTLIARYPVPLPRVTEMTLNLRVLTVAVGATFMSGLLVALPLMRAARRLDLIGGLRDSARTGTGHAARRVASGLVVVQVALSVVLLSAGALFLRTFVTTAKSDIGFDPSGVLVFNISPAGPRYAQPDQVVRFYDDFLNRIREIPGVSSVGVTQFLPFAPGMWGDNFARVGEPDAAPNLPEANMHFISPDLPRALGMRITGGRSFSDTDGLDAPKVAMVNETLARGAFGGDPLGRRIVWQGITAEIVGVVSDKKHVSLADAPVGELYIPWAQAGHSGAWVVVRGDHPEHFGSIIKDRLHTLDATIPMTKVGTMDARMADVMAPERFRATLASTLGVSALGLAALGLYGILVHRVARQTREIGIRLALGESPARVRRTVVLGALKLSAGGIVVGVVGAVWAARLIQGFMTTGLRARDPITFASVAVALLAVSAAAAWLPARRASRTDPLAALRQE